MAKIKLMFLNFSDGKLGRCQIVRKPTIAQCLMILSWQRALLRKIKIIMKLVIIILTLRWSAGCSTLITKGIYIFYHFDRNWPFWMVKINYETFEIFFELAHFIHFFDLKLKFILGSYSFDSILYKFWKYFRNNYNFKIKNNSKISIKNFWK